MNNARKRGNRRWYCGTELGVNDMFVTVAICTWNRARLLDQTLAALSEVQIPNHVRWELLVINNNCVDDTDAVLARHAGKLPLRRLFEPMAGHSNARNCALIATSGELLIWTDDDVLVPRNWIAEYVKAAELYPNALVFGGPIAPWFPEEPPAWIVRHWDRLRTSWAILEQGAGMGLLRPGDFIYGANMGMRTSAARAKRFDPNLGRKGASLLSGDDTAFLESLVKDHDHKAVWIGTAPVRHYIPLERLTTRYVWELHRCLSYVHNASSPDESKRTLMCRLRLLRYLYSLKLRTWWRSSRKDNGWLDALLESARVQGLRDSMRTPNRRPEPLTTRPNELERPHGM